MLNARFPEQEKQINGFFNELDKMRKERNDYVHSVWSTTSRDSTGDFQVNGKAQREERISPTMKPVTFTLREVRATTEKTRALTNAIALFIKRDLKLDP